MSNNKHLLSYNDAYAEYVSQIVALHNANNAFLKNLSKDSGYALRRIHNDLGALHIECKRRALKAYHENRLNNKSKVAAERAEQAKRRALKKSIKEQEKYEQLNNSTTNNV